MIYDGTIIRLTEEGVVKRNEMKRMFRAEH